MSLKKRSKFETTILVAATKTKSQSARNVLLVAGIVTGGIAMLFYLSDEQFTPLSLSEHEHRLFKPMESNIPPQTEVDSVGELRAEFKISVKPQLEDIIAARTIFSERASKLVLSLEEQFDHYSHLPNLQIIQMEMGQASSLIGEVEDAIVSHLARISRAYEEKNYHVFEGELASLEKLSPNNLRLDSLQEKSLWLRDLSSLIQEAQVARAQNRSREELKALEKIKSVGLEDLSNEERIQELKLAIRIEDYNRLSKEARMLRDNRSYSKALVAIKAAKNLFPQRTELDDLTQEINELYRLERVLILNKRAVESVRHDKWSEAENYYRKALELQNTNSEALIGLKLSEEILSHIAIFRDFLERPSRLTDPAVAAYAEDVLNSSSRHSSRSLLLGSLRTEVTILFDRLKTPRQIRIISDGKSTIEVKGVGFVKPTKNKIIELKPGKYYFHASCRGHVTNLVEVKVPASGHMQPIRIICGRRI